MSHGVEYGKASYWDERYRRDAEAFDWYQRWSGLQPVLEPYLQKKDKILMLGCGNSSYTNIVNIDISSVVINKMKEKHPELNWVIMDCTKMPYDNEFECAIDKGTLDALLCGDESVAHATAYLTGACRALKPGGVFFEITYGTPVSRLCYLEASNLDWTVKQDKIAKPEAPHDVHYIYICTKNKKQ